MTSWLFLYLLLVVLDVIMELQYLQLCCLLISIRRVELAENNTLKQNRKKEAEGAQGDMQQNTDSRIG